VAVSPAIRRTPDGWPAERRMQDCDNRSNRSDPMTDLLSIGIGIVGLLIWAICMRLELQSDANDSLFAAQYRVREEMPRSERASRRHEQSLADQSVRFFRSIGIGLAVIGFGFCGVLYVLGAFAD
jgi:hypothetical protein